MENTNPQFSEVSHSRIDKYYTKDYVAELCINAVRDHIQINSDRDMVIEPSAGGGAFIPGIKSLSNHFVFYDLEPEHSEIIRQDYLLLENPNCDTHVIGNPPFGRQSSLAIKFIKKSCSFCKTVSFILPKSFKKDSMKRAFPLEFHLIHEIDLPENAFTIDGQEQNVPCVFQIWEKKSFMREGLLKEIPIGFQFVDKAEDHDISFRRVGVYAGKIETVTLDKSVQSHYFIKFTNGKSVEENIERLGSVHFNHNNTVGPRSIGKQELIQEFNKKLI